jgi:hypothetical protein
VPQCLTPRRKSPQGLIPPPPNRVAGWAKLGTGLGMASTEGVAGYLHPTLAEALAIANVTILVMVVVVVFAVAVWGSQQSSDRVFRLLCCVTNRPELAVPGSSQPGIPAAGQAQLGSAQGETATVGAVLAVIAQDPAGEPAQDPE